MSEQARGAGWWVWALAVTTLLVACGGSDSGGGIRAAPAAPDRSPASSAEPEVNDQETYARVTEAVTAGGLRMCGPGQVGTGSALGDYEKFIAPLESPRGCDVPPLLIVRSYASTGPRDRQANSSYWGDAIVAWALGPRHIVSVTENVRPDTLSKVRTAIEGIGGQLVYNGS